MKKGFTLVELLGVIILLSVIALITYPNIIGLIENNKQELFDKQIDELKRQSDTWLLYNTDKVRREDMFTYGLTFNELYEQGLTSSPSINNPLTNSPLEGCMLIQYKDELNNFEITYDKDCIDDASQIVTAIVAKQDSFTIEYGVVNEIESAYFKTTFGRLGGDVVCKDASNNTIINTSSLTPGNHIITCIATGNNNTTASASITLTINPAPNEPILFTNMVPIIYNTKTSKWKYADITQRWYNYSDKQWANAAVLKANSSKPYAVGDDIEIEDIAQMYVWIPRYKYTIFNGNNGTSPEQLIDVTFEFETATTGTVKCYDNVSGTGTSSEICTDSTQTNNAIVDGISTYTHPAFCFGRKNNDGSCNGTELEGIWVGKFEASGSASATSLTVLPNKSSLVNTNVSSFFTAMSGVTNSFGIKDNNQTLADSHMMKNMEWGAVAYLKQSKYGLGVDDIAINNYYDENKSVPVMTGCGTLLNTTTCAEYHTASGMAASTTGNIYGIYDMAGGAQEYVMGNMVNTSGEFNIRSAGTFSPDAKYYDAYTYNSDPMNYVVAKLGDATKETVKSNSIAGGWYVDHANFPAAELPWLIRGNIGTRGNRVGIFSFEDYSGGGVNLTSARPVVTQS